MGVTAVTFSGSGKASVEPLLGRFVVAESLRPPVGRLGVPVAGPFGMSLVTVIVTDAIVTVEAGAVTLMASNS